MKYIITLILSAIICLNITIYGTPKYKIATKNILVTAQVKGMVCDFCARGLEKIFNNYDDVKSIDINLEKSTVSIELLANSALSNKKITEIIQNNGITTIHIERNLNYNSPQKTSPKPSFWSKLGF